MVGLCCEPLFLPYSLHSASPPPSEIDKSLLTFYSSNYFSFCGTSVLSLLIRDLPSTAITDRFYYLLLIFYLLLLFDYKSIKFIFIHVYFITISKTYEQNRALLLCLLRDEPFKSSAVEG